MRNGLARARSVLADVEQLDEQVGTRLRARFASLVEAVERDLQDSTGADNLAHALRQGNELIGETLACLAGAAARRFGYDQGLTSLAQSWLDQLSSDADLPQVGVVIPASTEFTGMLAQVVRLRVPTDGIWGLPVAVHEYGHFVASVLFERDTREELPETTVPVETLLHGAGTDKDFPRLYWHGHELFSDGLAAATAGPAYTWYCLRYRFDPALAQEITATHPAAVRRLRMQLRVLGLLAEEDKSGFLAADVSSLRKTWAAALEAAGMSPDVPPDADLDGLESSLVEILFHDRHLAAIRYRNHVEACAIGERLLEQSVRPNSVAQALNAVWCRRAGIERMGGDLEDLVERLDTLAERAESLVRTVVQRG
jgi:hypothetical protein